MSRYRAEMTASVTDQQASSADGKAQTRTEGLSVDLLPRTGERASSSAGVMLPGDFGSGNSKSSTTGVTGFGARRRAETASGFCSSAGRSWGGGRSGSTSGAMDDLRCLRGGPLQRERQSAAGGRVNERKIGHTD